MRARKANLDDAFPQRTAVSQGRGKGSAVLSGVPKLTFLSLLDHIPAAGTPEEQARLFTRRARRDHQQHHLVPALLSHGSRSRPTVRFGLDGTTSSDGISAQSHTPHCRREILGKKNIYQLLPAIQSMKRPSQRVFVNVSTSRHYRAVTEPPNKRHTITHSLPDSR